MRTSSGRAETGRPARYGRQLSSHLGGRLETRWDDPEGETSFTDRSATCRLAAVDGALLLVAFGRDDAALASIQGVVGRHLERFGQRDGLTVAWGPAEDARGTGLPDLARPRGLTARARAAVARVRERG